MQTKTVANPFAALRSVLAKSVRERKPVQPVKITTRESSIYRLPAEKKAFPFKRVG